MRRVAVSIVVGMAVAGCATLERPPTQPITSDVVPVHGFRIASPAAMLDSKGVRFHGWICRKNRGALAPHRLRIEQLNSSGEVVATATGGVRVPTRRDCSIYDLPTSWSLTDQTQVRLCADRGRACPRGSAE